MSHLAGGERSTGRCAGVSRSPAAAQALRNSSRLGTTCGTAGDQRRPELLGHVVVVALEAAPRDVVGDGESVQLVERLVADEVAPAPPAEPPSRLVDQDRHADETGTLEAVSGVELELRVAWQHHLGTSDVADRLVRHRARRLPRGRAGTTTTCATSPGWCGTSRRSPPIIRSTTSTAVVAAAFFHDAVYDPTVHDNEAESAAMAERALGEIGWTEPACRHVADMVMATAAHDVDGRRPRHRGAARRRPRRARRRAVALRRLRHRRATRVRPRRRRRRGGPVGGRAAQRCSSAHTCSPPELELDDWERRRAPTSPPNWPSLTPDVTAGSATADARADPRRTRTRIGTGCDGLATPAPTSAPAATVIIAAVTPVEAIIRASVGGDRRSGQGAGRADVWTCRTCPTYVWRDGRRRVDRRDDRAAADADPQRAA